MGIYCTLSIKQNKTGGVKCDKKNKRKNVKVLERAKWFVVMDFQCYVSEIQLFMHDRFNCENNNVNFEICIFTKNIFIMCIHLYLLYFIKFNAIRLGFWYNARASYLWMENIWWTPSNIVQNVEMFFFNKYFSLFHVCFCSVLIFEVNLNYNSFLHVSMNSIHVRYS